ncbi:lipopolysaccharide core heptose(II) kinase RfaY [Escherichia coli]|uniref:lipopolysaccharide core heptose(II) kinase RfaY n=1 Tax=Escherichia coli TaxID=562 RepID=UPI003EE8F92D
MIGCHPGKSCSGQSVKLRDGLAMERHLGIASEIKDYGYYSVIYRTKLRKFIKKFKRQSVNRTVKTEPTWIY